MTRATIATDLGDIEIELFTTDAPKASQNFVDLASKGYYDDVVFHRVIPGFVAQGGDGQFGKKSSLERGRVGTGGPGYTFEDEPVKGEYERGCRGDGERRPEYERQPVLHRPPEPDRQAAEELHPVRPGDQGHGRRGPDRQCAARRARPA